MQAPSNDSETKALALDVNWLFTTLDPKKTINAGVAMADILTIIMATTMVNIKPKISENTWKKVIKLRDEHNLGLEEIYSILEKNEKQVFLDEFIKAKNETLKDYFSSLLEALPDLKQKELLAKHPELVQLKKIS